MVKPRGRGGHARGGGTTYIITQIAADRCKTTRREETVFGNILAGRRDRVLASHKTILTREHLLVMRGGGVKS